MDPSPPNTGLISSPPLRCCVDFFVVIRTSVMRIVLWSSFGGAVDSGVHNNR